MIAKATKRINFVTNRGRSRRRRRIGSFTWGAGVGGCRGIFSTGMASNRGRGRVSVMNFRSRRRDAIRTRSRRMIDRCESRVENALSKVRIIGNRKDWIGIQ